MANAITFSVNDKQLQFTLAKLNERIQPGPLLNIAANVMRSSFEKTFREQGSPAGSWKPLAPSTLRRGKGGAGRKILIQSARLKNSITYEVSGNTLIMGSNLVYSGIQQEGGYAGRKGPFKKKNGRRPFIPARPYLVFRPEDPGKIAAAMERYIAAVEAQS